MPTATAQVRAWWRWRLWWLTRILEEDADDDSVGSYLMTSTTMMSVQATDVDGDYVRSQWRWWQGRLALCGDVVEGDVTTRLRCRRWWCQHMFADVHDEDFIQRRGWWQERSALGCMANNGNVSFWLWTSGTMTSAFGEEVGDNVTKCLMWSLRGVVDNESVSSHLSGWQRWC